LADYINKKADEIRLKTKTVSTLDLVILTLLNITDEMFQCNRVKQQTLKELEEKTEKLIKAMDHGI
jgi:cell division protein ZapA (FtsZ GTPase activity inhibitor)